MQSTYLHQSMRILGQSTHNLEDDEKVQQLVMAIGQRHHFPEIHTRIGAVNCKMWVSYQESLENH